MIKYFLIVLALVSVTVVSIFGFRGRRFQITPIEIFPDMDHQAKVKAQSPSAFFADGQGARLQVPGTVPAGYDLPRVARQSAPDTVLETAPWSQLPYAFTIGQDYFHTGTIDAMYGDGIPMPVTAEVMERGRERYGIYCSVCHGDAGDGQGIVAQYDGAKGLVASLHQERLRIMPDGEIYNTIKMGKGQMYGYGGEIPVADRWAIVAYVRALQISQNAVAAELPAALREKIKE